VIDDEIARPSSHAERLTAGWGKNVNPMVTDSIRATRLLSASFEGLIARLRAEGWSSKLILDAMVEAAGLASTTREAQTVTTPEKSPRDEEKKRRFAQER
jgi:hypothetical protein